ncbi:MAG: MotA/TolQ/ExbB proton channel family protein [Planctomycetota bacterium]
MKHLATFGLAAALLLPAGLRAQDGNAAPAIGFAEALAAAKAKLDAKTAELAALQEQIRSEKVPMSRKVSELETELLEVRREQTAKTRESDGRNNELFNLKGSVKGHRDNAAHVAKLLDDFRREFGARLHKAESRRYESVIDKAELAVENTTIDADALFEARFALVDLSLDRIAESLGGTRFRGRAADEKNIVREGTFLMLGPALAFRSDDGAVVGTAEAQVNAAEPIVLPYPTPELRAAAEAVFAGGAGALPIDPTLGQARKVEETKRTLVQEVEKGGTVMYPIFIMAGLALLIALYKWATMAFVRKPSRREVDALLDAVRRRDRDEAERVVVRIKGPVGKMLAAGVEHLEEPRELIEEVMYETVLTTRLRLEKMLPFIAICAASAPLLGLLGTVTGIIHTFEVIQVFGSGDVKSLSGGISEALITTKYGLIVAIPSLLLHAFLSRKARGIVGRMESAAVAFVNEIAKKPKLAAADAAGPHPDEVRAQVNEILREMLGPIAGEAERLAPARK